MTEARSFFSRLKGLLFTKKLPYGHGIHILPCRSIHTFFMKYAIDILYLDAEQRVVGLQESLQPGRAGKMFQRTVSVIELPKGTIQETETKMGQKLIMKKKERFEC